MGMINKGVFMKHKEDKKSKKVFLGLLGITSIGMLVFAYKRSDK